MAVKKNSASAAMISSQVRKMKSCGQNTSAEDEELARRQVEQHRLPFTPVAATAAGSRCRAAPRPTARAAARSARRSRADRPSGARRTAAVAAPLQRNAYIQRLTAIRARELPAQRRGDEADQPEKEKTERVDRAARGPPRRQVSPAAIAQRIEEREAQHRARARPRETSSRRWRPWRGRARPDARVVQRSACSSALPALATACAPAAQRQHIRGE